MSAPADVTVSLGGYFGIDRLDDHLASWVPVSALATHSVVEINLAKMRFCTPAIAVTIRVALRQMIEAGLALHGSRMVEPEGECGAYLRRMDVFKDLVDFENPERFQRRQPHGFRPAVDIVDEDSAVESSREALRCIQEQAVISDVVSSALFVALGEISENAVYHAPGTPASLMAQSYRWNGGHEIEIAAADAGPGVPTSLRNNAVYAHLGDADAMRSALQRNVTGVTNNSRRGLGLWVISQIVAGNHGTLVIRSGNIALRQVGPTIDVHEGAARWPGTLVALRLRLDNPLEVPEEFMAGAELDDYDTIEF